MTKPDPMVSVLMPVYNGERFLRPAIESILSQTYRDFEFLIINDGSIDSTESIILSYNDPRIVYVKNETNLRLIRTLNKGIELARGQYIARMDADDISHPRRLALQIEFLLHNKVDVIASSYRTIDETGRRIGFHWNYSCGDREIRFFTMFMSQLAHPTIFAKADVMKRFLYRDAPDAIHAEDLDLWIRLMTEGIRFALDGRQLLSYRRTESSITAKYVETTLANSIELFRKWQQNQLGYSLAQKDMLNLLYPNRADCCVTEVRGTISEFSRILSDYPCNSIMREWLGYKTVAMVLRARIHPVQKFLMIIGHPWYIGMFIRAAISQVAASHTAVGR